MSVDNKHAFSVVIVLERLLRITIFLCASQALGICLFLRPGEFPSADTWIYQFEPWLYASR